LITQSDRLEGKVAIVVAGGARGDDPECPGTGEAIARCMAASGARVAVVGRTKERTVRTIERIGNTGTAIAVLGDTTDRSACEAAVAEVVDSFGRVDVVVNNLGVSSGGSITEPDESKWDAAFAGNVKGPVFMTAAALPHLRASGSASVINISSVAGMFGSGIGAYGTTKAAMIALTRDMAVALGRDGIRVNCIIPGHLQTPMGDPGPGRDDARELRKKLSLIGIEGTGWDVGWAAVYLASDEAKYITAVAIPVDGGVTAQLAIGAVMRIGMMESYR
jgi:NAD(P)-dependent dehydrogenase (short-subunit alcohol dehydrogenase family)